MILSKNTYCSYCGLPFNLDCVYPKQCVRCLNITYLNPLPIVVVLLSVENAFAMLGSPENGILIQQRNIEPAKGNWALPSGYIDFGETWQQAAAREVNEEMYIVTSPEKYNLWDVKTSSNGNLLIFCNYSDLVLCERDKFVPNDEVMAIDVVNSPVELAFPTHTEVVGTFLNVVNHGN